MTMKIRLVEICKFLLTFSLGFTIKSLVELPSSTNLMPHCPKCPTFADLQEEQELLKQDIHFQLRESFKPHTMYEVIRYDYFDLKSIHNNYDGEPKTNLLGHQKSDIKDIIHQSGALYNSAKLKPWKIEKLLNGYRRFDPLRGEEYILDVELSLKEDPNHIDYRRFELVKPFGVAQMQQEKPISNEKMIHFVLPISGVSTRLYKFLQNFENVCLKNHENVYLLVVLFIGNTEVHEKEIELLKLDLKQLTQKYKWAHIRTIQTRKEFSRSFAIDLGAKQLPQEALMFFCDIDVQFTQDFLSRCRHNAIREQRVYYPVVFAQYDPNIVEKYSPADKSKNRTDINKYTGHYVHYGYGMVCLYKLDYSVVGGYNTDIKGWGGEDVDMYKKHVKSNIQVFRAPDPGLIHIFHDKTCAANLSADQKRMCINSMAESLGSRQQLGRLLASEKAVTVTRGTEK